MRKQPVRVSRIVRGLWPDHNPLRRASDRAEAGIVAVLIAAFLIGAPLAALFAWRLTFSSTVSTTSAVHAGWRQVRAVLLSDAPAWNGIYDPSVPAKWTAPDGAQRTGQIFVAPGARAGTTVSMWTNASGRPTGTPLSPFQAVTQADLVAAIAVASWGMVLLAAGMLGHHLLNTRRLAAWDADWQASNLGGQAGANPGR